MAPKSKASKAKKKNKKPNNTAHNNISKTEQIINLFNKDSKNKINSTEELKYDSNFIHKIMVLLKKDDDFAAAIIFSLFVSDNTKLFENFVNFYVNINRTIFPCDHKPDNPNHLKKEVKLLIDYSLEKSERFKTIASKIAGNLLTKDNNYIAEILKKFVKDVEFKYPKSEHQTKINLNQELSKNWQIYTNFFEILADIISNRDSLTYENMNSKVTQLTDLISKDLKTKVLVADIFAGNKISAYFYNILSHISVYLHVAKLDDKLFEANNALFLKPEQFNDHSQDIFLSEINDLFAQYLFERFNYEYYNCNIYYAHNLFVNFTKIGLVNKKLKFTNLDNIQNLYSIWYNDSKIEYIVDKFRLKYKYFDFEDQADISHLKSYISIEFIIKFVERGSKNIIFKTTSLFKNEVFKKEDYNNYIDSNFNKKQIVILKVLNFTSDIFVNATNYKIDKNAQEFNAIFEIFSELEDSGYMPLAFVKTIYQYALGNLGNFELELFKFIDYFCGIPLELFDKNCYAIKMLYELIYLYADLKLKSEDKQNFQKLCEFMKKNADYNEFFKTKIHDPFLAKIINPKLDSSALLKQIYSFTSDFKSKMQDLKSCFNQDNQKWLVNDELYIFEPYLKHRDHILIKACMGEDDTKTFFALPYKTLAEFSYQQAAKFIDRFKKSGNIVVTDNDNNVLLYDLSVDDEPKYKLYANEIYENDNNILVIFNQTDAKKYISLINLNVEIKCHEVTNETKKYVAKLYYDEDINPAIYNSDEETDISESSTELVSFNEEGSGESEIELVSGVELATSESTTELVSFNEEGSGESEIELVSGVELATSESTIELVSFNEEGSGESEIELVSGIELATSESITELANFDAEEGGETTAELISGVEEVTSESTTELVSFDEGNSNEIVAELVSGIESIMAISSNDKSNFANQSNGSLSFATYDATELYYQKMSSSEDSMPDLLSSDDDSMPEPLSVNNDSMPELTQGLSGGCNS